MIKETIKKEILRRIAAAEKEHNVRVLYAIESGSRAWGFESPDSDYDVRFIYAHPKDWYLSVNLEEKRDVIEYEIVDEIDINGWDVRKALMLLWKSNPAIVEWLQSPIVYVDDKTFAPHAGELVRKLYSTEKGIYHYRSMAASIYKNHLKSPRVSLKKYFYALRPLLSIKWIERYNEPAPIVFDQLRSLIRDNHALDEAVTDLLEMKKEHDEKKTAPAIPVIQNYIGNELKTLEKYNEKPKERNIKIDSLNILFREIIG